MPAMPQLPSWALALGATPEGLAAYRRRATLQPASRFGAPTAPSTFADPTMKPDFEADPSGLPPIDPPIFSDQKPDDGTVTPPIYVDPTGQKPPMVDPTGQKPTDDGTITPPIYPGPTGPPGAPPGGGAAGGGGVGIPVPPMPPTVTPAPAQRMAAFDFTPFQGKANYHQDAGFQQGWQDTFAALNAMDPETRARAEAAYEEIAAGGLTPGQGRGINAWRTAINRARGFEDEPTAPPTGTNPPPPGAGVSMDTTGITANSQGGPLSDVALQAGIDSGKLSTRDAVAALDARKRPPIGTNPRGVPPITLENPGGAFANRPQLTAEQKRRQAPKLPPPPSGFQLLGPMVDPNAGAMREVLGGMRRGGSRTPPNPRPTLPNESGQARPRRGGRTLNGGKAVVADESRQWQPRRRAPGNPNPRAGGY